MMNASTSTPAAMVKAIPPLPFRAWLKSSCPLLLIPRPMRRHAPVVASADRVTKGAAVAGEGRYGSTHGRLVGAVPRDLTARERRPPDWPQRAVRRGPVRGRYPAGARSGLTPPALGAGRSGAHR